MAAWILPLLTLAAAPSWTDKPNECARLCGTRALQGVRENTAELFSKTPAREENPRVTAASDEDGTLAKAYGVAVACRELQACMPVDEKELIGLLADVVRAAALRKDAVSCREAHAQAKQRVARTGPEAAKEAKLDEAWKACRALPAPGARTFSILGNPAAPLEPKACEAPCDATALRQVRATFKQLYDRRQFREAIQLGQARLMTCQQIEPCTGIDFEQAAWLASDLMLAARRLEDWDQCNGAYLQATSFLSRLGESEEKPLGSAIRFNHEACLALKYVPSRDVTRMDTEGTVPAELRALCKKAGPYAPNPDQEGAGIIWVGDLNGDGLDDFLANEGMCGNHANCMFGVYVGCGAGRFTQVLEEDAQDMRVLKTRTRAGTQSWLDLQAEHQLAPPAADDILRVDDRLVFDGTTYQRSRPVK